MKKIILYIFFLCFFLISGCSNDDENNPVTPPSGEVLLATVTGDSVGVNSGLSSRSSSITSGTLNFTDRDSARISFFYSGENNAAPEPMTLLYNDSLVLYNFFSLDPTLAEKFVDITFVSPRVNSFCKYKISTMSSPGFSYFKFRDLKIYKK